MSVLIDNSITIYEALEHIKDGKYVMPAFQRQYVWNMEPVSYTHLKELHRPYNTINKEVKSETVYLYNGKVKRYKPDIAEQFSRCV